MPRVTAAFRRRLSFEPCTRSLVAGHYLPLADNPGVAPEPDQTRSLQSDQRTFDLNSLGRTLYCRRGRFQVVSKGVSTNTLKRGWPGAFRARPPGNQLLELGL